MLAGGVCSTLGLAGCAARHKETAAETAARLCGDWGVAAEGVLCGVCHVNILPQEVAVHLRGHWVVHLPGGGERGRAAGTGEPVL